MARPFLMTWNAKAKRWFKKYRYDDGHTKMIAVGCPTLRKLYPDLMRGDSKEGSYRAANEWWREKEKQLRAEQDQVFVEAEAVLQRGEALLDVFRSATAALEGGTPRKTAIGLQVEAWKRTQEKAAKAGIITPGRFASYRRCIELFQDWCGAEKPVDAINEETLTSYYEHLLDLIAKRKDWNKSNERVNGSKKPGIAPKYAVLQFGTAKQFITWLAEKRLIQLPMNINSRQFRFNAGPKKIMTFPIVEGSPACPQLFKLLQATRNGIGERTGLYLLLMMNCGMYQGDVSDLVHDEVDWKAGTIQRKRSKNQERESAPTVTWFLWPITLDLLKKHQNTDQSITNDEGQVRMLVTAKSGPLVPEGLDGQRLTRSDNIRSAYRRLCERLKIPNEEQIPLKCIRKTSASLLDDHDVFGRFVSYFIGNSPRGVTDTHYKVPSNSQMKKLCEWLGQRYGVDQLV